ncbi:type II secretion system protein GspM [Persephonella sp.]
MRQILLYLENLETRERNILIAGLYGVIIIVGLFFIAMPLYEKIQKTDRKIAGEIEKYRELIEIASVYISTSGRESSKELSLSEVEKLAGMAGVKDRIVSLKPFQDQGIEVSLEDVDWHSLVRFIQNIKNENYLLTSFAMEKPGEKPVVRVRLIITE